LWMPSGALEHGSRFVRFLRPLGNSSTRRRLRRTLRFLGSMSGLTLIGGQVGGGSHH
jgi:hypothetical protein